MSNLKDFKEIPPITWGFIVTMVVGTIIPGILLVYLFKPDLFLAVETVKLLFLSMGITLPVWLINSFLVAAVAEEEGDNDEHVKDNLQLTGLVGALLSTPPLFFPALIKMIVDISSDVAFYIGFGIEIIIICVMVVVAVKKSKKK